MAALVKEAKCKGAGDMLGEYTYVIKTVKREKNKKGQSKEEARTYEVYFPTLKSGAQARGVLLMTSRDGVAVPPDELTKERLRAGERLEKEQAKSARQVVPQPALDPGSKTGLTPLGMYARLGISRGGFGIRRGGAVLDVQTFLTMCELTVMRVEQHNGRRTLVFSFTPRRNARFDDDEKYIAQLRGTIWIDEQDRIVARLVGWPSGVKDISEMASALSLSGAPPAVCVEMMRLPEGVWLLSEARLSGADYAALFDGISYETIFTHSEYKRFRVETKDAELETTKSPR